MKRIHTIFLTLALLSLLLLSANGCSNDGSPVLPVNHPINLQHPKYDDGPIGVNDLVFHAGPWDPGVYIDLYNNSEVTWGGNIGWPGRIEMPESWMAWCAEEFYCVEPGEWSSTTLGLDRDGLSPGLYTGELRLIFYDTLVRTLTIEMEVSSLPRVKRGPIGVNDTLFLAKGDEEVHIDIYNNSNDTWVHKGWPIIFDKSEPWMGACEESFDVVDPGEWGSITLFIDRERIEHGIYLGYLRLVYNGGVLALTIIV